MGRGFFANKFGDTQPATADQADQGGVLSMDDIYYSKQEGGYAGDIEATGGTVSNYTMDGTYYKVHTFSHPNSDNFVVSSCPQTATAEFFVVAGGGCGANGSTHPTHTDGGGGAGGLRTNIFAGPENPMRAPESASAGITTITDSFPISAQTYPITVGGGAAGATGYIQDVNGEGSFISSPTVVGLVTAMGGGGGAYCCGQPGDHGGCGGGATGGGSPPYPGGEGKDAIDPLSPKWQGYDGGSAGTQPNAGGGGGAGSVGNTPGNGEGGYGINSTVLGGPTSPAIYCTGGDRTNTSTPTPDRTPTNIGAGGHAGARSPSTVPSGSGNKGIIIIRYPVGGP